ncbi:lysophospholipid acyltransferase family protein [bacterium]|nr:lysophospholipid acyltransferase family protein [bacterium]
MRHTHQYFLGVTIAASVRYLPRNMMLFLGSILGDFVFYILRIRRKQVFKNLKFAFGNQKSDIELKKIARETYKNLGKTLLEFLQLPRMNGTRIRRIVDTSGLCKIDPILKEGKGAILLGAHFGNWELLGAAFGLGGYPVNVIGRLSDNRRIGNTIDRYRGLVGMKVIQKNDPIRKVLRALNNNELVAILMDQNTRKDMIFADFFGRPAATAKGPAVFALRTGAPVVPTFIVREGKFHKILIGNPIYAHSSEDADNDIQRYTAQFSKVIESYIRQYPDQWFWLHNRWKTRTKHVSSKIEVC